MHPHWEHEGHQKACDHWWTHQTQIGGSQENLWFVLLKWWFSAVLSSTPSMQMSLKHMPSLICRPNDCSFWQLLRVSRQPENFLRESLVFWVPIQEAEPQFPGRTSATQLNQENVCLAKSSWFASSQHNKFVDQGRHGVTVSRSRAITNCCTNSCCSSPCFVSWHQRLSDIRML
jgi:hypothetical protein